MSHTPDRRVAQALSAEHLARGDGTGWFERLYAQAGGDPHTIPWADGRPSRDLVSFLDAERPAAGARTAVVGCGLGDDAAELARRGLRVTAFDLAPSAVEWCGRRFPDLPIEWRVQDLLTPFPAGWTGGFELVVEIYTLQSLPAALRARAAAAVASLVAPGGRLLTVCRSRPDGTPEPEGPPWPLAKADLRAWFGGAGLAEASLHERQETEDDRPPPVTRAIGVWRR